MKEVLPLNTCQAIQKGWENPLLGERNIRDRIERFKEEADELIEYLEDPFLEARVQEPIYNREVGNEAIDCIILALSVIDSLGLDAENLFIEKLYINYRKYPLREIEELKRSGLSPDEALLVQKQRWNTMPTRS